MKNNKQLEIQTQLWIKNKQDLISGKTDANLLMSLLKRVSPENENISFRDKGVTIRDHGGLDKIAQGFELSVDMPIKEAVLLQRCLKTTDNQFGFSNKISFEKLDDNNAKLKVETTGDYLAEVMKNPRFSIMRDRKSYATYSLFRASVNAISANAIYQLSPETKFNPSKTDMSHPRVNRINDFLLLSANTHISNHKDIDSYIDRFLTKKDIGKATELFVESLSKPKEIRSERELAKEKLSQPQKREIKQPANDNQPSVKFK